MVFKTVILLLVTFGAYGLIISGKLPLLGMWALCLVMGMGLAGLGFSVAHDAVHGAYSKNKNVNYVLGLVMNLIGGNRYVWSITHNIIHHTYTNIYEIDEDLEVAPFIRLSKHARHRPIHRIQHIIGFLAYGFATIFWVLLKDFKKLMQKKIGPYTNKKHPSSEIVLLIIFKVICYAYMIVIPLLVLDVTWWQFLIGFLTMHMTAGIILGVVFQLAHTVEGTEHHHHDTEEIKDTWAVHQMKTTSNFAMKNKIINWYVGGLNFQIEHHLFPRICSIHYPAISKIVQQTAETYEIPYNYHPTFIGAIQSHYRVLKQLGARP
ncbi:MAG: acyl-CoA desaturase [Chitinophagales bacterium]|nr:acyl-CoA desaturase [Chitinophagales bacterium]